jgi:hypothetical protein
VIVFVFVHTIATMPSTPPRKRSKKAAAEVTPVVVVDMSLLQRDWKSAQKRLLKYINQQQRLKIAKLQFIEHFKAYRQKALDENTTELYHRIVTKSLNSKWVNRQFTASQLLVALASLFHHGG